MSQNTSHDQNFKNLILDYPLQALQLFAPKEAAHLDEQVKFTPIREEQLKDRLSDRFLELDIPLLLEWPDGRREAFLFVIEQQTDPRQFSIHKLARYCLEVSELMDTPRVVPVVIFLKKLKTRTTTLILGNEFFSYLQFHYIQAVLPDMPAEQYLHSTNLVARVNLPNMQWPDELKLAIHASAVHGIKTLEQNPDKQLKYLAFIDIYMELDDNERRLFKQLYPQEEQIMSSYTTSLVEKARNDAMQQGRQEGMQQGRQEGMQKGITEGIAEGKREAARNLLKLGLLSDEQIAAVVELPLEQLQDIKARNQH